jgi:hypothetical protein
MRLAFRAETAPLSPEPGEPDPAIPVRLPPSSRWVNGVHLVGFRRLSARWVAPPVRPVGCRGFPPGMALLPRARPAQPGAERPEGTVAGGAYTDHEHGRVGLNEGAAADAARPGYGGKTWTRPCSRY